MKPDFFFFYSSACFHGAVAGGIASGWKPGKLAVSFIDCPGDITAGNIPEI